MRSNFLRGFSEKGLCDGEGKKCAVGGDPAGETARALAEEFGVSVESVYKRGQRERLEQRGSLQQAARKLCRSAGSMVAQMEDMDAKELKELTALLRELVTLEERTDKGPETVKVVLAKEAEEWSR